MRLAGRPVLLLTILALAVHAGATVGVWRAAGGVDAFALASRDSQEYVQIARNLLDHQSFSVSTNSPRKPDTWRTPGYPLFLAMAMVVVGRSAVSLVLLQQGVAALSVVLLFLVARRWMPTPRALAAAILFLMEPYRVYYSFWLLSTTFFVALLLLLWLVWQHVWRNGRWPWFALTGSMAGLLILARPLAVFIPPALLIGIVARCVRLRANNRDSAPYRLSWVAPSVFAAAALLVVGSWMLRNRAAAGHFALSHQGGIVLAYFKATEVRLWREDRTSERYLETTLDPLKADVPHTVWEDIDRRLRARFPDLSDEHRAELKWQNLAQGNKTNVDSFAVSLALWEIGWSELTSAPLSTVACFAARFGSILTFPLNLSLTPPRGVSPQRLGHAILGLAYALLCGFVLLRLFRRNMSFDRIYFPLTCTLALLLATAPQLDPRFRVPMIPLLLVIAWLPVSGERAARPGPA